MAIEWVIEERPQDAALRLGECDSVDDLEDALRELLSQTTGAVVLDFRVGHRAPVRVPEAALILTDLVRELALHANIRCLVSSELAKRAAERMDRSVIRPRREAMFGAARVSVIQGDISRCGAAAIVNASNVRLVLGAGVSGAIKLAVERPDALQSEMSALAPIEPGQVVVTSSNGLGLTRVIFHAATAGGGEQAVARAYHEALALAARLDLESIALPALGSGTGGLAIQRSAELLLGALEATPLTTHVICVLYGGPDADMFADVLGAK